MRGKVKPLSEYVMPEAFHWVVLFVIGLGNFKFLTFPSFPLTNLMEMSPTTTTTQQKTTPRKKKAARACVHCQKVDLCCFDTNVIY